MAKHALQIGSLTVDERLDLIEELWESLTSEQSRIPLTPAQQAELDRRLDDVDAGTAERIPWGEARSQIRSPR